MNRTQNSPKRRQEKQLSARRKTSAGDWPTVAMGDLHITSTPVEKWCHRASGWHRERGRSATTPKLNLGDLFCSLSLLKRWNRVCFGVLFRSWPRQNYCTAKKFRQRKISSKATVRQFVRNLFSSNGSLVLSSVVRFACLSVIFTWLFLIPHLSFWGKFSQEFNLVKKLLWRKRRN